MSEISKVFVDPTTIEREFTESGLECCTRTTPQGHRCGYVAIPKGHPLFGVDYSDEKVQALEVDGGITFGKTHGDISVLGWDAGHGWHLPDTSLQTEFGDYLRMMGEIFFAPIIEAETDPDQGKYVVDADMAEAETRKLARQLAEMQVEPTQDSESEYKIFARNIGDLYRAMSAQGIPDDIISTIIVKGLLGIIEMNADD